METNINSDLGESSEYNPTKNDTELLQIVNTANIACGYHAGDLATIKKTIQLAKINNVSVGAHPSFKDRENFGRKRIKLTKTEVKKLVIDQLEIMAIACDEENYTSTHVKPHGALNNMACEDFELAFTIGEAIKEFDKNLIYMVLAQSEMEKAAQKINISYAAEIFADRNYEDNATLVSRSMKNALITKPEDSLSHVLKMLENKSIFSYSGKQIPCQIDTICIHSDGPTAVPLAKYLIKGLKERGYQLKTLNSLIKFN